jgi:dephospho-CoA kinase
MIVAALTGNYGMGKSAVLAMFRELGAVTLDSDRIVEVLLKQPQVIGRVNAIVGGDALAADGGLDKKLIARRIFGDTELRRSLEDYLHPLVLEKVEAFIDSIKDKELVVVVEVPLLFEGDYQGRFGKTITVHTTDETAIERLVQSGVSKEDALARLKAQMPVVLKIGRSDYVIDNDGTKENTQRQVAEVHRRLVEEMEKS